MLIKHKLKNGIEPLILAFLMYIVLPFTVYHNNANEFDASLSLLFKSTIPFAFFVFSILFIPSLIGKRTSSFIKGLCLVLSAYVIIVTYFVSMQTGVIDGTERSIILVLSIDVEYLLFVGIVSLILSIYMLNKKLLREAILVAAALSLPWVIYITFAAYQSGKLLPSLQKQSSSESEFWSLSKEENILVFSLDGLQSDHILEVLRESPELSSQFDGFTFYEDTLSPAPVTFLSVLAMQLGALPKRGLSNEEAQKQLSGTALFGDLKREGYDVSIQDPAKHYMFIERDRGRNIMCYVTSRNVLLQPILQTSLSRAFPFKIKLLVGSAASHSIIWINQQIRIHFGLAQEHDLLKSLILQESEHIFNIAKLDVNFISRYTKNLNSKNKNKTAQYYHFLFTHEPHNFDRRCVYHLTRSVPQNYSAAKSTTYCALTKIGEIVKALKREKIYDNSLIFFTSDHGYGLPSQKNETIIIDGQSFDPTQVHGYPVPPNRYNSFLMFKRKGSHGKLVHSNDRVSLLDIMPTICENVFKENFCAAKGFEGVSLNHLPQEERERYFLLPKTKDVITIVPSFSNMNYIKSSIKGKLKLEVTKQFKERQKKLEGMS